MAGSQPDYDVAIIGGGIVGLATAMAIASHRSVGLVVLEAEDRLATHQTGHNSGVIHSGLYYEPGSLKAKLCVEGRRELYRFCEERGIAHKRCGKLVVATNEREVARLEELELRGRENGLEGLRRLSRQEMREFEPHVAGRQALLVPETGVVDFAKVAESFADVVRDGGGQVRTKSRVLRVRRKRDGFSMDTANGPVACRNLINCTGLQSDRVTRMCGADPKLRIVPFKGEYFDIVPGRRYLVRTLVYPVPDPRFPFLGVHFTRNIHGRVLAGPSAVLAFKREGYGRMSCSPSDILDFAFYRGFWRMAGRQWKTGIGEMRRSLSKRAFVRALRTLIPETQAQDLRRADSGIRAQAVEPDGKLVDDFRIIEGEHMIHVLNAPSPAATASISIGRYIADLARDRFDLS